MKIVVKFQDGHEEEREWMIGKNMHGIRITKLILESQKEMLDFLDNSRWAKHCISYSYLKDE